MTSIGMISVKKTSASAWPASSSRTALVAACEGQAAAESLAPALAARSRRPGGRAQSGEHARDHQERRGVGGSATDRLDSATRRPASAAPPTAATAKPMLRSRVALRAGLRAAERSDCAARKRRVPLARGCRRRARARERREQRSPPSATKASSREDERLERRRASRSVRRRASWSSRAVSAGATKAGRNFAGQEQRRGRQRRRRSGRRRGGPGPRREAVAQLVDRVRAEQPPEGPAGQRFETLSHTSADLSAQRALRRAETMRTPVRAVTRTFRLKRPNRSR